MGAQSLQPVERRIVERTVNRAIELGYHISVWDGEEYAVKFERDPKRVLHEMAATDMDRLVILSANKQRIGTILFIYGNGEDVLSDFSWSTSYSGSEKLIVALCA